jgi:acetylornithine deacetylase/succinyl-diaminopimelate desuccinylase-like protein
MSEKLERMLRIVMMNQVEIMTALEELLSLETLTDDDHADRAEIRANLDEAIEQTVEALKDLKEQEPGRGDDLAGQA